MRCGRLGFNIVFKQNIARCGGWGFNIVFRRNIVRCMGMGDVVDEDATSAVLIESFGRI